MPPQTTEHFGGAFNFRRKDERLGQVIEIVRRTVDLAHGAQPIERATLRQWREKRDRAPSIRDLNRFASFDASQQFAGALSELPDPDGCHVLLIAQAIAVSPVDDPPRFPYAVGDSSPASASGSGHSRSIPTQSASNPHSFPKTSPPLVRILRS